MSLTPRFDADQPRYDLSTFQGRFMHFVQVIDPRVLLYTDEEIRQYQAILQDWRASPTKLKHMTDEQLWQARKVVEASVHPATNEIINPLFRMAAFVPTNLPICYFMITTTSPTTMLFWHWVNQTYNSAVNYSNRSGGQVDTITILQSYGLAVATSCSLAAGLGKVAERGWIPGLKGSPALVSYIACAAAGSSNILFSRQNELREGTAVTDDSGKVYGNSLVAGRSVVLQTAVSRGMFIPAAVLLLPPFIMNVLGRLKLVPSNPRLRLGLELAVITGSLAGALPVALASFPQRAEFNTSDLEPQFQDLKDASGQRIAKLYTNKGL